MAQQKWMSKWTSLGLAVGIAMTAPAAQAASEWQINTSGTGASAATPITQLNIAGGGFVQIIPDFTDPTRFTFIEHGAYQAVQADGETPFGGSDLTVVYQVSGTGSFLDPYSLNFSTGLVTLYSDPVHDFGTAAGIYGANNGTAFATLAVTAGGLDPISGLVSVTTVITPGGLAPGYLFDSTGKDLSLTTGTKLQLGIFNQLSNPDELFVSEIVCELSGFSGAGCDGTPFANSPLSFTVQDGGFVLMQPVPEPLAVHMTLGGLALLGWVARRRRREHAALQTGG